jgi:lactoylglutathione lyase
MITIGMKIQEHRIKNGLSQEMLAEKLGVSRQSVSKWEIGQALPVLDNIVAMSRLFAVTADELLLLNENLSDKPNKNRFHFCSIYSMVKNFKKSMDFYEKLLAMRVSTINPGKFAEFFFDNKCISLMNEFNLQDHDYNSDHKFVLKFLIDDLQSEYERIKKLNIGNVSEIKEAYPEYYYFHITDPDKNVIEITGSYKKGMDKKTGSTTRP